MIGAVVPAAGRSMRMGRAKLVLELGGQTVLARVVSALVQGGAGRVVVVVPPADSVEGPAVAAIAVGSGAEVVVPPARPSEMRDSIELGLAALAVPKPPDRVLIAPGDSPGITPTIVARLLEEAGSRPECIVVPRCGGRRGHPIVLPWGVASEASSLPSGLGLNALVARHEDRLVEVELAGPDAGLDLDTPDDLRRWAERLSQSNPVESPASAAPAVWLRVRLFAAARERAGRSEIDVQLRPGSDVAGLKTAISDQCPALGPLLPAALIAVDEEYAGEETIIRPGSRIAIIPPVSGGAGHPCKPSAARWAYAEVLSS